jgi:hypothetical protein
VCLCLRPAGTAGFREMCEFVATHDVSSIRE